MSFERKNFARVTSQFNDKPDIWTYASNDSLADVNTAGYFDDISDIIKVNDVINVISSINTTAVHSQVIVLSNANGIVDVSDGVVVNATDTD